MLGISRGSLANIETGRQSILVHQLYSFAGALGLSPFELLPAPAAEAVRAKRSGLPLPTDLKAQQRKQVADFFMQIDTSPKPVRDGSHAKATQR